ncbi:AIR synthase family protein [Candidatus Bathyarchaeota archaeon]|nr:AIR synthase family protein [Candidatus Bathyarchaeota archaeon]
MSQDKMFLTGKVSPEVLKKCVFPYLGTLSNRIIKGPGIGEDAPIIDFGEKALVVKANPITGAEKNIGTLVVHITANDVAVRGAKPKWFLNTIFLQEGATEDQLTEITSQMHDACKEIGVQIIGGHTECTPTLKKTIISGFMIGEALKENLIINSKIEVDDKIIMTKTAGIEGTSILSTELYKQLIKKIDRNKIIISQNLIKKISIVPDALTAIDAGGVNYLHTPTEGGLLNGIYEMSEALKIGVLINEEKIKFHPLTIEICDFLKIDPLKLMSSGTLLIVADKHKADKIIEELSNKKIGASIIGEVKSLKEGRLLKKNSETLKIEAIKQDEVYRILYS